MQMMAAGHARQAQVRHDAGALQVDAGLGQGRLPLRHIGLRALDLRLGHALLGLGGAQGLGHRVGQGLGLVGLALGDELALDQHALALQVPLGLGQVDPGAGNAGARGGMTRSTGLVRVTRIERADSPPLCSSATSLD